jgi:large subunit ribosomal protein L13
MSSSNGSSLNKRQRSFFANKSYSESKEFGLKSRGWKHLDVTDQPVGRAASEIAKLLRGKYKQNYTPHVDLGDFVVVTNAAKLVFTGGKGAQKTYYHHTGYIGGIKSRNAGALLASKPEEVLHMAVQGMLPKGILGRGMLTKLKIYRGSDHPHQAQQPQKIAPQKVAA